MDNPYKDNLGHWLKRCHLLATQQINELLRPHGLARAQWNVLLYVDRAGELAQKDLQQLLQIEPATLTGIVDALIAKQWLERVANPHDRRAKLLRLTPQAAKRWQHIPDPLMVVSRRMLQGVAPADVRLVRQVLEQAVHNLEKL